MRRSCIFLIALLVVFTSNNAFAQQTSGSSNSHKYRTILTIAGAAGGFATGYSVARVAYDLPNSQRQVLIASAMTAGVGAAGGFLIGWAIDSRRNRNRISLGSDKFNVTPLVSTDTKGLQFSVGF